MPPHSVSSESPGVQQLTEDSLLFDGPRATYGRFRILHQIGAGSVGPVFRGEDSETRRPVVIKVIRVGLTPERVAVVGPALRALKERLVAHPALCPILETGVVDIEPFVVSPVIEGDSLDVALREYGPANMADAIPRLRALADALDAAAAVDVAHGSLHLRDVVVSVDATVLTGIGIAAVLERVGVRPPVRRPYCAPEVALGRGISPAGDQYALAAIAHEWLSGRRLSSIDTIHVPTSSADGAQAIAAVFSRALAAEADLRYPSATAFVDALADVADLVTPRGKTARRKAVVPAPLLEFDTADDPPALSFAAPVSASVASDQIVPADGDDEVVPADDAHGTHDAVAAIETAYGPTHGHDHDLPLASGPRDLGEVGGAGDARHLDARRVHEPYEAAPLPYADTIDEAPETAVADDVSAGGAPIWLTWAAVVVVGALLVVFGGRALLRWGTPSGPAAATTRPAAGAEPPRQAVASPPTRPEPAPVTAAPPTAPAASPASEPPQPVPEVVEAPRTPAAPAASTAAPSAPRPAPPAPRATAPAPKPASPPSAARATAARAAATTPVAPAAAPGRLLVRTTPSGAEVFLNGERRGVSPLAIRDLALGVYAVRLVRPGFDAAEQRVVLESARPARALEVALSRAGGPAAAAPSAPAASTGSLLVESRPSGARVYLDGVDVGRTPVTVAAAAVGSRAVRIELTGYLNISTTTRVEPGARARVAVTLTAERPR